MQPEEQIRDEYCTAESLRTFFETIPEACIVEFLREAGFFYLIWKAIYSIQHIMKITDQLTKFGSYSNRYTLTTPLHSVIRLQSINSWENPTCEKRLVCLWGHVVKQIQSRGACKRLIVIKCTVKIIGWAWSRRVWLRNKICDRGKPSGWLPCTCQLNTKFTPRFKVLSNITFKSKRAHHI